jgi:3',5'-nucleoside bisphosphate phosphatase
MPEKGQGGADLHLHSNHSDGSLCPSDVVETAISKNLEAMALTDHDSISGVAEAREAAGERIEVIAGVEFGTPHENIKLPEVHIVGLFLDPEHDELQASLELWRQKRHGRAMAMIEKLNQLGLEMRPDDVLSIADGGSISRLHIAKALQSKGYITTIQSAFRRYIGNGGPAFVARERPPTHTIIDLIHRAGGVAILAHPALSVPDDTIPIFAEMGVDGIEAYCIDHSWVEINHYEEMAKFYGLLVSGGSDCHGHNKDKTTIGVTRLDMKHVEALRQRARQHKEEHPNGS